MSYFLKSHSPYTTNWPRYQTYLTIELKKYIRSNGFVYDLAFRVLCLPVFGFQAFCVYVKYIHDVKFLTLNRIISERVTECVSYL